MKTPTRASATRTFARTSTRTSTRPKGTRTAAPDRPARGMQAVGVRELKASLSAFLRRVGDGESLIVTDRGRPVARLSPPDIPEGILRLMREGKLIWSGRKPDFDQFPLAKLRGPGPTLSEILIEDRHKG